MRRAVCLGSLLVCAVVAAGCSSGGESAPPTAVAPHPLEWKPCPTGECATLRVPLDYASPGAGEIELALARPSSRAVLLVREGDGHIAYQQGSSCIDAAVDAYLLSGTLPPPGRTCPST